MQAMEISRSGLDIEWRRLEVIADNIANINSAGTSYQPRRLVSGPRQDFKVHLDLPEMADQKSALNRLKGVEVKAVESLAQPPRLVHEPGHPLADQNDMVAYPAIDHAAEMISMIKSSRAYEANIVALNNARQMYSKALELGRR